MKETKSVVQTKVGPVDALPLEAVGPRTKYWAEAIQDLAKVDELYRVLATALDEALRVGRMQAVLGQFQGRDILDVEAVVVREEEPQAAVAEPATEGPQPEQPAPSDQADGSTEPQPADGQLPGSL